MLNTVDKLVIKQEIVSITCDKCGVVATPDDVVEFQEFHSIWVQGGYGSVFGDGSDVSVDFCQRCLKELIGLYIKEGGDARDD